MPLLRCAISSLLLFFFTHIIYKLRHSLSSQTTFQRNDKISQNEAFYYGLLEILEASEAKEQVSELIRWYNK